MPTPPSDAPGSGPTATRPPPSARGRARRCGIVGALTAVVVSMAVGLGSPTPALASGNECLPLVDSAVGEQPWPPGPDLPYGIAADERSFEVRLPPRSEVTISVVLQNRRTGEIRVRRCVETNLMDTSALVTWPLNPNQPDLVVRDVGPFAVRPL